MRQSDLKMPEAEFPTRYALDEARFSGGRERIFNEEGENHEPTADLS